MPFLRVSFPENEKPSVIVLRGDRVRIGRRPDNTIQLRDRTVSAYHADLLFEGDHYRLHDVGATNAVVVNGAVVTDFHLTEPCKIAFGAVECEFSPESPAEGEADPARTLITRTEAEALERTKTEQQQRIANLEGELATLRGSDAAGDLARVAAEQTVLKDALAARERELETLRAHFTALKRERDQLERTLTGQPAAAPAASSQTAAILDGTQPVFARATPAAAAPRPSLAGQPAVLPKPAAPVAKPVKPLAAVPRAVPAAPAGPKGTQKIAV